MSEQWIPQYEAWRHGGWYVMNTRYPSGAVGCVSRNYSDRKWRIVCDDNAGPGEPGDITFKTRDDAARAEHAVAEFRRESGLCASGLRLDLGRHTPRTPRQRKQALTGIARCDADWAAGLLTTSDDMTAQQRDPFWRAGYQIRWLEHAATLPKATVAA